MKAGAQQASSFPWFLFSLEPQPINAAVHIQSWSSILNETSLERPQGIHWYIF